MGAVQPRDQVPHDRGRLGRLARRDHHERPGVVEPAERIKDETGRSVDVVDHEEPELAGAGAVIASTVSSDPAAPAT